jgi:ABC-2 type transport system permease protein
VSSSSVALAQYQALSRRSIVNLIRQPTAIVPALVFPLIFMALSAASLNRSTDLPGFPPVDSFLQFLITTTIFQGALFGAVGAGTDMARDIEGGFFDRLIASPVSRMSILVGRVTGSAALGFTQAWLYFLVGMIFGLTVEGGFLAMLLVAIVAATVSAAIGAIAIAFGLKTGSSEAVQGSFPLLFTLLFLSSAFFPRNLMNGWFKSAATINPFSHLIEGLRTQVIAGINWPDFFQAFGIALVMFAIGAVLATSALRGRIAEGS